MFVKAIQSLIRRLPTSVAVAVVTRIVSLSRRTPLSARDRAALGRAQAIRWGGGGQNRAWVWGQGPTVLLVHGWNGRAAQMAPLAESMAARGFRAIAPDLSGHGASPGRHVSFRQLVDDVAALTRELGEPLHALVGHSAGGLAMMAARGKHSVRAERYICLNAPRAPYPPIKAIRERIDPRPPVIEACRHFYAAQFDCTLAQLDRGEAFRYRNQGRLLLIHDRDDDQVDPADADVVSQVWPDARVLKTEGLGHHRLLWADRVKAAVADFASIG